MRTPILIWSTEWSTRGGFYLGILRRNHRIVLLFEYNYKLEKTLSPYIVI